MKVITTKDFTYKGVAHKSGDVVELPDAEYNAAKEDRNATPDSRALLASTRVQTAAEVTADEAEAAT